MLREDEKGTCLAMTKGEVARTERKNTSRRLESRSQGRKEERLAATRTESVSQ